MGWYDKFSRYYVMSSNLPDIPKACLNDGLKSDVYVCRMAPCRSGRTLYGLFNLVISSTPHDFHINHHQRNTMVRDIVLYGVCLTHRWLH